MFMIYQRPMSTAQVDAVNRHPESSFAKAYMGLLFPSPDNAQERVTAALNLGLYQRTMLISATDGGSVTLEQVFNAGNNHIGEGVNVVSMGNHPSMSVGDIAVSLLDDDVYLCMPHGWHVLDMELSLEPANPKCY
jgi:hypothetical protein